MLRPELAPRIFLVLPRSHRLDRITMPLQRPGSLLAELQRRRVFRVAAGYAAVAFVLLQATSLLLPSLPLPPWTYHLVVWLLVLGFPIAVVLGWAFDLTPDGVRRTASVDPPATAEPTHPDDATVGSPGGRRRGTVRVPRTAWFVAGALVTVSAGFFLTQRVERGADELAVSLDPGLLVVLPFRVSGDASVAYLREGMVDLLAATLTGDWGARAADPRTVLSAWQRALRQEASTDLPQGESLALARSLGAGQLLLGAAVGTPHRLILTASIVDVPGGRVRAEARVEGAHDSVTVLVDRLAARLLAVGAGETDHRLASLTTTSLPALRAFLAGQAANREGREEYAIRHYQRALEVDTAFALAAVHMADVINWVSGGTRTPDEERALRLAWSARDRLSPRDRAYLLAIAGPRYPLPPSGAERIAAAEKAVELAGDRPEPWLRLADEIFHLGALVGMPDPHERSAAAFRRVLSLDSTWASAYLHLVDLASAAGDREAVARLATLGMAVDGGAGLTQYLRWRADRASGDTVRIRALREDMAHWLGGRATALIPQYAQQEGSALEDAELILASARRAVAPAARTAALHASFGLALNRGRPDEAERAARSLAAEGRADRTQRMRIMAALWWEGDPAAAADAARELARRLASAPDDPETGMEDREHDACVHGLWRLREDTPAAALTAIETLQHQAGAAEDRSTAHLCIALLDALHAAVTTRADAAETLDRLDDLARSAPPVPAELLAAANLTVASLREANGDLAGALAAARRRLFPNSPFLSTFLRTEGALAAVAGERDAAISAYRHYLALRSDPEPAVRDEVERVRSELAGLVAHRRL
jgi:eukaryotic-like serine/threonine-protein kinase